MTTCAVYLRISKDAQGEGLGIERQRTACQDLAKGHGWHIDPTWVLDENDTSATKGRRPKFERLLEGIESGEVRAVVAYSLDRLQRRLIDLARLIDAAEKHDVPIVTASGQLDMTTPLGRSNAKLLGVVASIETDNLADRLRRKASQNVATGKVHNGGRRPYGYTVDRKSVVDAEAEVIREVAARLIGGESLTAVAKDLNRRDLMTGGGRRWDSRRLREVMARPRLCGRVVHRGAVLPDVKGEWPPILDSATWERVQVAMAARRLVDDRWTNERKYLLSGVLMRCGLCGEKMHVSKNRDQVPAYRCRTHVSRNMALTDAFVISEVHKRADEVAFTVTDWFDPEQAEIAERITSLEAQQVEAAEEFVDGGLSPAALRAMDAKFTREIAALRDQQAESFTHGLEAQAAKFDLSDWDSMTLEERRTALTLYVEKIVVHPQKTRGRGAFDTAAIEIVWRDPETLRFRAVIG